MQESVYFAYILIMLAGMTPMPAGVALHADTKGPYDNIATCNERSSEMKEIYVVSKPYSAKSMKVREEDLSFHSFCVEVK